MKWLLLLTAVLLLLAGTDYTLYRAYEPTAALLSLLGVGLLVTALVLSFTRWPVRYFARGYLLCAVALHLIDDPRRELLTTVPGFSSRLTEQIMPHYLPSTREPGARVYYRVPERPQSVSYRQYDAHGKLLVVGQVSGQEMANVLKREGIELAALPFGPTQDSFQAVLREFVIFWLSVLSGTILLCSFRWDQKIPAAKVDEK